MWRVCWIGVLLKISTITGVKNLILCWIEELFVIKRPFIPLFNGTKKTAKNGLSRWFHLHRNFPRQYLRCLNINYVDINKNITDVQDWMQTQTLQKKTFFVSVFNEFYPWHTLPQKYMKTNTKAASDKDQKLLLAELYWHRSYHSNVMTSSSILLAVVFLCIRQRLKIVISRIILT